MEEMEKSQEDILHRAQQELRKEMATMQKKILMDTVSQVESSSRADMKSSCAFVILAATTGNGVRAQVPAEHALLDSSQLILLTLPTSSFLLLEHACSSSVQCWKR